ncbi:MAG: endonuclease/exonuclease/phosphatase family protein [Gammaproteobacteria bacterium]
MSVARSLVLLACALTATNARADAGTPPGLLKLATWNLEWLIAPAAFKPLKSSCIPAGAPVVANRRRLPCDVAQNLERSARDFAVLARYARQLDADVVSLQEVDGPQAARLVFPDYEFCFTGRPHVQNNGFAIRAGIAYRCGPDHLPLSLGDSVRRGAELVLFPGEPREIRLLSVHLKSGCPEKPLATGDRACRELSRQLPALESWIDAQARAGRQFGVLGDFNRELTTERRAGLWSRISDGKPPEAHLVNAAAGQRFRNCVPGQGYAAYIDHIVLSRTLGAALVPGTFGRVTYSAADARRAKLSDHCPVAVSVHVSQIAVGR